MSLYTGVRFALHANQFTERGDSVTLMSIATGLREELGIESIITFPDDARGNSPQRVSEARALGFQLLEYSSRRHLEEIVRKEKLTHNYVISDGSLAGIRYSSEDPSRFRLLDLRHLTQAVFRRYEPHGDVYAYISDWLYGWSQSKTTQHLHSRLGERKTHVLRPSERAPLITWVPHIVEPHQGDAKNFRKRHEVPLEARLIGRVGGFDQFSDRAAQKGLMLTLDDNPDTYALAVNTKFFGYHDRLIYCEALTREEIWDFYAACDVLLNGRKMGESFGFSIAEPLSLGKPVVGPGLIRNVRMDQHHIKLLKAPALLYSNARDLKSILERELKQQTDPQALKKLVESFSQPRVMKRFAEVFIHANS